jgi:hypothetical protein
LAIFFADFSLAATPSGTTVTAGNNATYTITAAPTNGFNLPILLSCGTIPVGTTCIWNPPGLTLGGTGTTASSTLTIETDSETRLFRHPRPPSIPPGFMRWVVLLTLLTLLGAIALTLSKSRTWMGLRLRLMLLLVAVVLVAFAVVGCENYVNPININPVVNGTPAGTYSIQLSGTVGNGSGVTRSTVVNLSVLP